MFYSVENKRMHVQRRKLTLVHLLRWYSGRAKRFAQYRKAMEGMFLHVIATIIDFKRASASALDHDEHGYATNTEPCFSTLRFSLPARCISWQISRSNMDFIWER